MNEMELLIDLHRDNARQGPGSDADTRLAITLSGLRSQNDLKIADIGCGTGASTFVLADELDVQITAVDFLPEFLEILADRAKRLGIADRIKPLEASMDKLPFEDGTLDAVWAEGAIYNIGFENGISAWRRFLKPRGILAASEITWLTDSRPNELDEHWNAEYPEIDTASQKIAQLESHGYVVLGYFPLPQSSWLDHYYNPIRAKLGGFLSRHADISAAQDIVNAEEREIDLYERFSEYVSYGFYIARRSD